MAILGLSLAGCPHTSAPPAPAGAQGRVDDFGLPLEITIHPPAVPKEIVGPFPPVKEQPAKPLPAAPSSKGKGTTNETPAGKPSPPTPLPKGEGMKK